MSDDDGYICGFHIKADGTTKVASMEDAGAASANDEWIWLHFDVNGSRTHDWLKSELGLDDALIEALTSEGSRPRTTVMTSGTLIILRGVNLHPESDPTDMLSVRLWVEPGRIVSSRFRRLLSMQELLRRCEANAAPANVGQFVVDLNLGLIERMSGVIHELDAEIDALEESNVIESVSDFRQRLVSVRQKIIPLRRFICPQRDALSQMLSARVDWLDEWQRGQIREAADRLTRYVEELDAMREKALHHSRYCRDTYVGTDEPNDACSIHRGCHLSVAWIANGLARHQCRRYSGHRMERLVLGGCCPYGGADGL